MEWWHSFAAILVKVPPFSERNLAKGFAGLSVGMLETEKA
jgi:hypothetical protein